jgi:ACS family tartrate transporter-like MFS transporter
VLRFLLGVAEAGFFPGMILYLTYWFPAATRARIVSAFMIALPISTVIGSPVSTAMLSLNAFGLHGWQLMFLAEGIPAVLIGVVVLAVLRDGPAKAAWLTDDERTWLRNDWRPSAQHLAQRRIRASRDCASRACGSLGSSTSEYSSATTASASGCRRS